MTTRTEPYQKPLNSTTELKREAGPFCTPPLAPLAAGGIAHARWTRREAAHGPFADWDARNAS